MKKPIFYLALSCMLFACFNEIYAAGNSESTCNVEHDRCAESCDRKHSTPKYDVWGKSRKESDITLWHRDKCKNKCVTMKDFCVERKRKLENAQKGQEEIESEAQEATEYTDENISPGYPSPQADSNLYKWTDENGVIHITNKMDSIPAEHLEKVEQTTN